ncbi:hypothetical protein CDLVIII_1468 [Clostridium sp. DL-VIII]|uniref:hypothetical protein n=1 Tax=Clostridium sp. DL-VIII TaxID=641107 RepID=UPI00023AF0A5|nr:hypothetical protein [Clostridium sp. DL-VIII]EHI98161.1 hypothetical protein CDLVIII_1468 [Clostridium sp. DL-VIII]
MYINDYSIFVNLYSWLTDSCSKTSIKIREKSDFFDNNNITQYESSSEIRDIAKIISYNYVYNYIYYLEKCINESDYDFSFSKYENIYEIRSYVDTIEDIDLSIFLEWFIDEGVIEIVSFLKKLEVNSYTNEDMYNIMKYYNYLMDNSSNSDIITKVTFLTECATEVFNKVNKYIFENVTVNDIIWNDDSDKQHISFDYWELISEEIELESDYINLTKPACHTQALFYKTEVCI